MKHYIHLVMLLEKYSQTKSEGECAMLASMLSDADLLPESVLHFPGRDNQLAAFNLHIADIRGKTKLFPVFRGRIQFFHGTG
jgi:hypothetical protein